MGTSTWARPPSPPSHLVGGGASGRRAAGAGGRAARRGWRWWLWPHPPSRPPLLARTHAHTHHHTRPPTHKHARGAHCAPVGPSAFWWAASLLPSHLLPPYDYFLFYSHLALHEHVHEADDAHGAAQDGFLQLERVGLRGGRGRRGQGAGRARGFRGRAARSQVWVLSSLQAAALAHKPGHAVGGALHPWVGCIPSTSTS